MKVMIVDDEVIIRTGLSTVIDWAGNGFKVLEPAASAEEALLRLPVDEPDLVFTDIRMTGRSGLELARDIRKDYPNTEVIIISGFDDFVYAQQALREGVGDYLLKTSRPDEIIQAAIRARERLLARRQSGREESEQRTVLNRSFLRRLLGAQGVPSAEAQAELWGRYPELRLTDKRQRLQIWLISGPLDEIEEREGEEAQPWEIKQAELGSQLMERLPAVWLQWGGSWLLLLRLDNDADRRVESEFVKAEASLGIRLFAGGGRPVDQAERLQEALETAEEAASYKWLLHPVNLVRYEEVAGRKGYRIICSTEEEAELASWLRAGNGEALSAGVRSILARIRSDAQATPRTVLAYVHSLILAAHRWLERASVSVGQTQAQAQLPEESSDSSELSERPEAALLRRLEAVMKLYGRLVTGNSPVQRAVSYIHEHLEERLSLGQVAQHVHMNPNYLSEMFRRETGQTYIEFVTQAKLRKAMTLLIETPAKVSEVANQIGYEDMKHFNRLFKKFTGQTPSEYRSKC